MFRGSRILPRRAASDAVLKKAQPEVIIPSEPESRDLIVFHIVWRHKIFFQKNLECQPSAVALEISSFGGRTAELQKNTWWRERHHPSLAPGHTKKFPVLGSALEEGSLCCFSSIQCIDLDGKKHYISCAVNNIETKSCHAFRQVPDINTRWKLLNSVKTEVPI